MESIDDLLAEIKAEYEQQNKAKKVKKQPDLLGQQTKEIPKKLVDDFEDSLLSDIKAEFEEAERVKLLEREAQLKQAQLQEKQLREQKTKKLKKQAEIWLKKLDPLSGEGLWFEDFAEAYPSKIEAAIDYLQALEEANL